MKKYSLLICSLLIAGAGLFTSCKYEPSMEETAIREAIAAQKGEVSKFGLTAIEQIGEVTIGQEIGIRTDNFRLKYKKDSEFEQEYTRNRMARKAEEKARAMARDLIHIAQLDSIKAAIADRLDEVAYREYKFSATCTTPEGKLELKDWYAAISPDGKVLSMVQDKSRLHSGLGVSIPGWKELFATGEE